MRHIAARAGVRAGTLYAHFGSKAGLFHEALGRYGPGAVTQASSRPHTPGDLPAFAQTVWSGWATPAGQAAFALYLRRSGGRLPQEHTPGAVTPDLQPEVRRAHLALARALARTGPLPAPAHEVAWVLATGLLTLRATFLHAPGGYGTAAALAHMAAAQRWLEGGERPC